jgi:hypothetical protein
MFIFSYNPVQIGNSAGSWLAYRRVSPTPYPPLPTSPKSLIMDNRHSTLLANEQRRDILQSLYTGTDQRVATRAGDPHGRKIRLVHVDLPLLEDLELITWDRESHSISQGSAYPQLKPLLLFLQTQSSLCN